MKTKTVLSWATIFGIEIVDCDGFQSVKDVVDIDTFYKNHFSCTIHIYNWDRYNVLTKLFEEN